MVKANIVRGSLSKVPYVTSIHVWRPLINGQLFDGIPREIVSMGNPVSGFGLPAAGMYR
jgi:hypothetical protein